MVPTLETKRLILRRIEVADAPQIQRLFPQWEIVKYLNKFVPWPYPADGALTFVRDLAVPAMEQGDECNWTIRLKSEPEQVIGCINLTKKGDTNRGFWLGLPWHGHGYMTEANDVVTEFWFETLGFEVL